MADEQPPLVKNLREGPELGQTSRPYVPSRVPNTPYPLIDNDPHFTRVVRYARPSDYFWSAGLASTMPIGLLWMERVSPSEVSPRSFASVMRLAGCLGGIGGFLFLYANSIHRFYGFSENRREVEMDMREMTNRVKAGLPLYGESTMSDYLQGAAARQSRYSGIFLNIMPWFNFANHAHHGVDTAKYYRNAERELEEERLAKKV